MFDQATYVTLKLMVVLTDCCPFHVFYAGCLWRCTMRARKLTPLFRRCQSLEHLNFVWFAFGSRFLLHVIWLLGKSLQVDTASKRSDTILRPLCLSSFHFLFTTSHLPLPTFCFPLPASCYPLPASHFPLPTSHFLFSTFYFLISTFYFLLFTSTSHFHFQHPTSQFFLWQLCTTYAMQHNDEWTPVQQLSQALNGINRTAWNWSKW